MPEITMQDGSTVNFGERAKVVKQSFIDSEGDLVVKFAFANGEYRTFRMTPNHPLFTRAALHGLNQKFGDAFAGVNDVEDMLELFDDTAAQLNRGEWNERRVGNGESLAGISTLALALCEVLGKTKDEVRALLQPLNMAEKQALRRTEPVASVIRRIEAERNAKSAKKAGVDGSAVLAQLQRAA